MGSITRHSKLAKILILCVFNSIACMPKKSDNQIRTLSHAALDNPSLTLEKLRNSHFVSQNQQDLGGCNQSNQNVFVYLTDENNFYVCKNNNWMRVNEKNKAIDSDERSTILLAIQLQDLAQQ